MADEAPEKDPAELAREANEKRNQSRLDRMNAIADGVDEERDEDGMLETDGDRTFERERREREEQEESERELAEMQARDLQTDGHRETEGDEKDINGVRHYLTVVNGKEKWLTLKQLRATAQKVESADEYLSTAADAARKASQLALSAPTQTEDVPAQLSKEELRDLLARQALGDEEAIEILASVFARPSAVTPDVVQQIDQRLSIREAQAQVRSEHKDIFENQWTARLMGVRIQELQTTDPTMGIVDAYRQVAGEIRKAFPETFKKTSALDERRERKRTLVNAPTAAGRAQARDDEGDELDYEGTVAAGIAAIAKARGQATAIQPQQRFERRKP